MMKHKLLLIAQAFPPIAGSLVPRAVQFVKHISAKNWEIHVLTIEVPNNYPFQDIQAMKHIPTEVSITRSKSGFLRNYYLSTGSGKANDTPNVSKFIHTPTKWLRNISTSFLIPDTFIEWVPFAISEGNHIMDTFKPDIIVSMATPFSTHIIAATLAKKYHCPLLLDYADPWLFDASRPRKGIRYIIEYLQEKSVLKQATHITVVTHATKLLYEQKWPFLQKGIDVISMGFDPEDFNSFESPPSDSFILTYTGRLPLENRDATPFFQALSNLKGKNLLPKSLKIEFWGHLDPKWVSLIRELNLDKIIVIGGWVTHSEFCSLLLRSHGLILFGNRNTTQIPGKVFHYLGSGRPILLIKNSLGTEKDPTESLVKDRGGCIVVENSTKHIEARILDAYTFWNQANPNMYATLKQKATQHTWQVQADKMDSVLQSVLSNHENLKH